MNLDWSTLLLTLVAVTNVLSKQDCAPGDWSDFSVCSQNCGATGTRQRDRKIQVLPTIDGKQCSEFEFKQVEACNRICYNGGSLGNTECKCRTGWTGPCCQTDINECNNANAGCEQKCVNTEGSFRCECFEGFEMNSVGDCKDVDECIKNNGGCEKLCMNFAGGHTCGCVPPKFLEMDQKSCADENYCVKNPDALKCEQHCVVYKNAFKCECPKGYKINDQYNCVDENECNDPEFCTNGGDCTNTNGTAYCDCGVGRGLDPKGKNCMDVDECKPGMNQCSHICQNVNAGHVCLCPAGLEIGPDHKTCQDENECERDPPPCSNGCQNLEGSYICTCPEKMELEYDNRTCCEVGKCIQPISNSEASSSKKSQTLIITFSVLAVVIVLVLVVVVWRALRRTISTNEKVMRAIRHGDVPDVYYNRNAEIEMETRGLGLAASTSRAEPYQTFQRRNVLPKSFTVEDNDNLYQTKNM